ncbi:MAG: helix-turn-helix domain-containing protein [Actinomycetes bacterium]
MMEPVTTGPDGLLDLPAGAQRLLAEARRILRTKGAAACTVGAVTEAAGLDKSAVRYYFGNKDGMIVALGDSILTSFETDERRRIAESASADDPLGGRIAQQRKKITGPDATTMLELAPVLLRHGELRCRFADWQRRQSELEYSVLRRCGDGDERSLRTLATVVQAIVMGLTVQSAPDPSLDVGAVLRLLLSMLRRTLGIQDRSPADPAGETAARLTDAGRAIPDDPMLGWAERLDVPDPLRDVPESGRRLVRAAQRILEERGWASLTVSTVTAAAGLDKAAVSYYFGDKAGLVSAMVESTLHDQNTDEIERLVHLGDAEDGLAFLVAHHRRAATLPAALSYFELLPQRIRDPQLRQRMLGWDTWYRDVDAYALALYSGRPMNSLTDLATLTGALTDGVSLRLAADPEVDIDGMYTLWEDMLRRELAASE